MSPCTAKLSALRNKQVNKWVTFTSPPAIYKRSRSRSRTNTIFSTEPSPNLSSQRPHPRISADPSSAARSPKRRATTRRWTVSNTKQYNFTTFYSLAVYDTQFLIDLGNLFHLLPWHDNQKFLHYEKHASTAAIFLHYEKPTSTIFFLRKPVLI